MASSNNMMTHIKSVWEENSPASLLDMCAKFCILHLETFCEVDPVTNDYRLHKSLTLPTEICEKLINAFKDSGHYLDDKFVNIFHNTHTARLRRVSVKDSHVTDEGMHTLLTHSLVELDISNCANVTEKLLDYINEYGESLLSLNVGTTIQIFPKSLYKEKFIMGDLEVKQSLNIYAQRGFILRTPNLKRLSIRELYVVREEEYFPLLLKHLKNLTHLDLSRCSDLGSLQYLCELQCLVSLILYNVRRLHYAIPAICRLTNMRHLDISQSNEKHGTYRYPSQTLKRIVESLPLLISLDISGTNLAGTGVAEVRTTDVKQLVAETSSPEGRLSLLDQLLPLNRHSEEEELSARGELSMTDILGLESRINSPLEFLGLYNTMHDACHRYHIPAKLVSGDASEEQILVAAAAYVERPEILQKVLNDLFHIFRYETCHDTRRALDLILQAMNRHLTEKHIQIAGSASLFYIVKTKEKQSFNVNVKHQIISTLLSGMNGYRDDTTMMRNGCLTLCQFKIPQDVLFDYERLVDILLHIVSELDQEEFVQRIGIYLLNSLACQVDGYQKQLMGELGAMEKMLMLVEDRLSRQVCDDVMEIAWSTMWNVTDETAINCQCFLDGRGMDLFLKCLKTFPEKAELLRNMMGLLGNVAEVQYLRPRLMTTEFVTVFSDLLDSTSDGIEVSYNAAGVLSHMGSDGQETWTLTIPRRDEVLKRMVAAIEHWDLNTKRNINYRSFEPILRLLRVDHTPECQHWAIWALANLTRVYPDKYCPLVEEEGGVIVLEELLMQDKPYHRIRELASMVMFHCQQYRDHGLTAIDDMLEG